MDYSKSSLKQKYDKCSKKRLSILKRNKYSKKNPFFRFCSKSEKYTLQKFLSKLGKQ